MKKILLAAAFHHLVFGVVGCAQQGTKEAAAPAAGRQRARMKTHWLPQRPNRKRPPPSAADG